MCRRRRLVSCGSWGWIRCVTGWRSGARLGVCPQLGNLDADLSVVENLTTYARYFGLSRAEARRRAGELLEFVQLADRAKGKVEPRCRVG